MKLIIIAASLLVPCLSYAQVRINPIDDGSLLNSSSSDSLAYVKADDLARGAMVFEVFDSSGYDRVFLALNPYGLPLWDLSLDVYAYDYATGVIDPSYYDGGVFCGTLNIPSSVGYGEDILFDVTNFVGSVRGSYFGIVLKADSGVDIFSSLEYNYGNPSGLIAIPEPAGYSVLFSSAILISLCAFRRVGRGICRTHQEEENEKGA